MSSVGKSSEFYVMSSLLVKKIQFGSFLSVKPSCEEVTLCTCSKECHTFFNYSASMTIFVTWSETNIYYEAKIRK